MTRRGVIAHPDRIRSSHISGRDCMELYFARCATRRLILAAFLGLSLVAPGCGGSSRDEAGAAGPGQAATGVLGTVGSAGGSAASASEAVIAQREFVSKFSAELTNLDALAASLKTPAEAFAFVRDKVAFEPYRGVMKGAQGTLLTRGGNAIDRALLLSAVLKRQGHAASIVAGDLQDTQAAAILAQISRRPSATEQLAASLPATLKNQPIDAGARKSLLGPAEARGAILRTEADSVRSLLAAALDRSGRRPTPRSDALASVRSHYWVRANLPGGATDLDPTLDTAGEGARLTQAKQTFDSASPPQNVAQRLVVRVVAEFVEAGVVKSKELVRAEVKVADVAGEAIRVVVGPKTLARKQNDFAVVLSMGDGRPVGAPFQITSTTGPKRSVGDMLGGGDSPEDVPTLARLALEVVSSAPGAPDVTYRRVILDRLDAAGSAIRPEMRDDESVRSLLVQAWDGVIDVGAVHPARLAAIRLQAAITQQPMMQLARDASKPFTLEALAPPSLSPLVTGFLYFSGLTRTQAANDHAPGSRVYHLRPRVAFLRSGLAIHDWTQPGISRRYQRVIDLLNAPFGIVGPAAQAADLALRIGVADATLERSFAKPGEEFTTIALMQAAGRQHAPMLVAAPGQESAVSGLDVPSEMISVLRGELAQGRTLVLPTSLVALNDIRTLGWWSLDAESGVPLGQMELGAGQAGVEIAPLTRKVMEMTQLIITFYGNILGCFFMEAANQLGDTTGPSPWADLKLVPNPKGGRSLAQCIVMNACEAIAGYTMLISTSYAPEFAKAAVLELTEMVVQMLIAEHASITGCHDL